MRLFSRGGRLQAVDPKSALPRILLEVMLLILWLHLLSGYPGVCAAQEAEQEPPKEASDEKTLPPARQNDLLRDFFRTLYPRYQRDPPVDEFVENFVDNQIDAFLREIEEVLTDLNQTYALSLKLRERWLAGRGKENSEARDALVTTLRRLGDRSDDLADRLSTIFVGLQRNKKIQFTQSAADDPAGFLREFDFLGQQLAEATRLVTDYFFRSTNTVDVTDLGSENMLVRLDWAEFMAKDLAKRIR